MMRESNHWEDSLISIVSTFYYLIIRLTIIPVSVKIEMKYSPLGRSQNINIFTLKR